MTHSYDVTRLVSKQASFYLSLSLGYLSLDPVEFCILHLRLIWCHEEHLLRLSFNFTTLSFSLDLRFWIYGFPGVISAVALIEKFLRP